MSQHTNYRESKLLKSGKVRETSNHKIEKMLSARYLCGYGSIRNFHSSYYSAGKHSRGLGWYETFKEKGNEGFSRAKKPTPFNWNDTQSSHLLNLNLRSLGYFKLKIDNEGFVNYCFHINNMTDAESNRYLEIALDIGSIEFELADDLLPQTCKNFKVM